MEKTFIRFRYGRLYPDRRPKTLLATCRFGDFLFFGISRCNKCDVFKKKAARDLALPRLTQAFKEHEMLCTMAADNKKFEFPLFYVAADGLFGFVHIDSAFLVYKYFDQIDPDIRASKERFSDQTKWFFKSDFAQDCFSDGR